jgi:hypothetical protein
MKYVMFGLPNSSSFSSNPMESFHKNIKKSFLPPLDIYSDFLASNSIEINNLKTSFLNFNLHLN